jgi:hypothetical protein
LYYPPYIDNTIIIGTQCKISSGENVDMNELGHYRAWQKAGAIVAGVAYDISCSGLFGIIFAYGRNHYQIIVIRKKLSS